MGRATNAGRRHLDVQPAGRRGDVAVETADVVLMQDNPADVGYALKIARAVHTKIKQNLFWAAFYIMLAIPVAAGVLYPRLGVTLQPEWSALLMTAPRSSSPSTPCCSGEWSRKAPHCAAGRRPRQGVTSRGRNKLGPAPPRGWRGWAAGVVARTQVPLGFRLVRV